jgi:Ion channel
MGGADATSATAAPRWRPGARVERLRASHSFGFVFALVVCLFLIAAALPDASWARSVIVLTECVLLGTAVWTSGVWQDRRAAGGLIALAALAAFVQLVFHGDNTSGVVAIFEVALLVATVVVIAVGVVDQREVNAQSIFGAVSIYVLLGMLFVFVYSAAAALGSGLFFAQGTDGTLSTRVYLSYVTLGTLGYGDYTAAGDFGRTVSVIEAMLGQIYLVTVIALLVGRLGGRRAHAP